MGKGGGQVIGYKYIFGLHLILCSNPVDVLEIQFQDKTAWFGRARGGSQIRLDKPELFGGEEAEGGVVGDIDILDGNASQPVNDYLASVIEGLVPAFRHVSSLVFRAFYHGNNPYPKSPKIKVIDALIGKSWEPTLAWFPRQVRAVDSEIYIGIDSSSSMITAGRYARAIDSAAEIIRSLKGNENSIRVHFVGSTAATNMRTAYNISTDEEYEELAVWVETTSFSDHGFLAVDAANAVDDFVTPVTEPTPPPTDDNAPIWGRIGVQPSLGAIGRRVAFIMTDAESVPDFAAAKVILDALDGLEVYCFYVNEDTAPPSDFVSLDNTPDDGVPTVEDTAQAIASFKNGFTVWADMNPAHILRDALLATVDNQYVGTDTIGDSFLTAAETLFTEDFGLSFLWRNGSDVNEFKTLIEEHIDGACFKSRYTGKWEIKLFRDDYDPETLSTFDVLEWKDDLNRELLTELPNKVVLTYSKMENGETCSVTVSDPASISMTGTTRPVKVEFEGIYWPDLAARVAGRELLARSQPKWSGTIVVGNVPRDFDLGSLFKVVNPQLGIYTPIVCRALEITYATNNSRNVTIKFVEDKFSIGTVASVVDETVRDEWIIRALNVTYSSEEEAPYYILATFTNQDDVNTRLADEPLLGLPMLSASRPSGLHVGNQAYVNAGSGWELEGDVLFAPVAFLAADVAWLPTTTTIEITSATGLDRIRVNSLAKIDNEYMRIISMSTVGGVFLEVARGCLDTVPEAHLTGASILFFHDFALVVQTEYLAAETVGVRYITRTASDALRLAKADIHNLEFANRAIRPLRPSDMKINGGYLATPDAGNSYAITFNQQNRLVQTSAVPDDYLASEVAHEASTTYELDIHALDSAGDDMGIVDTEALGTDEATVNKDLAALMPVGGVTAKFVVYAVRDTYRSWTGAYALVDTSGIVVLPGEADFFFGGSYVPPSGDDVNFTMDSALTGSFSAAPDEPLLADFSDTMTTDEPIYGGS